MDKQDKNIVNHFEAGANCQVFNGNISGCVFAMPGASVTQQPPGTHPDTNDSHDHVAERLEPLFFGQIDNARAFLMSIQGMKPKQITNRVNQLVRDHVISDISCHRDLWSILHECGIYVPTESNWNAQVK